VVEGRAEVSISLRANAPWPWRAIGIDYISGERVLHRRLLAGHTETLLALPKFGFEVFLNSLILRSAARVAIVPWPGVASPLKSRKYGLWAGIRGDAAMIRDLCRAVPPHGLLRQIVTLRKRRI